MLTPVRQGCGILFFDAADRRVLLFLRDDKPNIRCPNCLDILGGIVEREETPREAMCGTPSRCECRQAIFAAMRRIRSSAAMRSAAIFAVLLIGRVAGA